MLQLVDNYQPADEKSVSEVLKIVKDRLIEFAFKEAGGNIAEAARILKINRTTLVEHFRNKKFPGRKFLRRRNRGSEQPFGSNEEE